MKFGSIAMAAFAAIVLAACNATFQVKAPDAETQRFATDTVVEQESIIVAETIDLSDRREFLIVRTDGDDVAEYSQFFKESIIALDRFQNVYLTDDFELKIIKDGHAETIGEVTGPIGQTRAAEIYGPFMTATFLTERDGTYSYTTTLIVRDAVDGRTLYQVRHSAFNWSGLDQPLFYPVFNAFADWVDANSPGG
jgi:hypothetical protein